MKRPIVFLVTLALLVPLLTAVTPPQRAEAANAALFDPGNIISDANMYDGGALNAAQVQGFLEQRVTSCVAGYTCLRDYRQATPTMPASAFCPGGYAGSSNERASDIIAKVGAACNISPKVLIVLLEKEQSLVTMRNPPASRFDRATGFSCPDTAPCDPAFAGFFYQVYYAARQFQKYAQNPAGWNYQAGRVNSILYHPNAACGRGNVYIQNKATAGLYIYTPYQPNAAALGNLYGTGDGCSSYGNRNFWRIYSDWFGSPTVGSSLLRSASNATVYLVSGDTKYPVPSMAVLASLAPLGQVAYVSDNYLNALTTGHTVGRSIRGPDGSIYFYDAGKKLPFISCDQAFDYGASCEPDGYVQLTEAQVSAFVTGPALTSVLGTATGGRYYIQDGTKAEILDDVSQAAAGIPAAMNVLSDNALAHLRLVAPIARDSVFVLTRGTSTYSLIAGTERHLVAAGSEGVFGVATRTPGSLTAASLDFYTAASSPMTGYLSSPSVPEGQVLTVGQRLAFSGGTSAPVRSVQVSDEFLLGYPLGVPLAPASFLKSPTNGTIYVVMPTDIRPISGWSALLALTPTGTTPSYATIAQPFIDALPKGPVALNSGTMARSPSDATVFLVNGVSDKIAFSSFFFPVEAGFTEFSYTTEQRLAAYPTNAKLMGFGLTCGTNYYVSAGGSVHLVAPELIASYPFDWVALDPFLCAKLRIGVPATSFIRTPDGSIYQLVGGEKRPIASFARFQELSGGQSYLNVAALFGSALPTGPLA